MKNFLNFDDGSKPSVAGDYHIRDLRLINICHLIVDQAAPCAVFLYLDNKWQKIIDAKEIFKLSNMKRVRELGITNAFIPIDHHGEWVNWVRKRTPQKAIASFYERDGTLDKFSDPQRNIILKNRTEFFQAAQAAVNFKHLGEKEQKCLQKSHALVREFIYHPFLEWFFLIDHPENRMNHCVRLASTMSLFLCSLNIKLPYWAKDCMFLACFSYYTVDPEEGEIQSVLANDVLKKEKHPFPAKVIETLKQMDEFHSGKGSPDNLSGDQILASARVISVIKSYLAQYMSLPSASRRKKKEHTFAWMRDNHMHFEPNTLKLFMEFVDNVEIYK